MSSSSLTPALRRSDGNISTFTCFQEVCFGTFNSDPSLFSWIPAERLSLPVISPVCHFVGLTGMGVDLGIAIAAFEWNVSGIISFFL